MVDQIWKKKKSSWNVNASIMLRQSASLNTTIKPKLLVDGFITGIQLDISYLRKSISAEN